jgi:uncharacterized protein YjbI with pentapeptide repeats
MPSLLRRILSGQGSKGRSAQEEAGAAKNVAVAEAPAAEPTAGATASSEIEVELGKEPGANSPSATIHQFTLDERGLIPADQLPSAAAKLAELFPAEESLDPIEDGLNSIAAVEEATSTHISQTELDTQRQEVHLAAEPVLETIAPAAADPSLSNSAPDENIGGITDETSAREKIDPLQTASFEAVLHTRSDESVPERDDQIPNTAEISAAAGIGSEAPEPVNPDSSTEGAAIWAEHVRAAEDAEILKAASISQLESPASSGRDWHLEERLAGHLEWLDSHGKSGTRADLSDANLEGQELIGVKLKFADLHDANLRAADLLLADLRDASLVRADLEDSCLVGANLEAANLEGASLETAMGLVPRQIAGANLRDAQLPPHIMEFPAAARFARASRIAWRCFAPLIPAILISWLIIWKTKDAQLLTDSALIPYLHSRTAAAAMPTAQVFLLAPLLLFSLYLVFHFQLQKVWEAVMELPAIFPDGHPLDDGGPGIVVGLLRAHFWWINRDGSSTLWVEKTVSVLAAYWAVPFTLTLFWARYLTMQESKGTLLQALLVAIAAGVALHATLKTGRAQELWATERKWAARFAAVLRNISPAVMASVLGAALLLLSVGTMTGIPHDRSRAPQYGRANIRRWAADVFWAAGFDPYADVTEAAFSRKPANWSGANSQISSVKGPELNEANFRYAQAYGVFLANAHLWQSDFEGAYLSEADLRGADLGHGDLRRAILDGALLSGANLNRARLDGAVLARADLRWANLSYASLSNAMLVDSRLDGATLYDAQLFSASLARADLEKVDLRGSYLNLANLDHTDLQQALLWSAKLPGANLYGAKLQSAVAIDADFRGADLREAQFAGTVLSDANLAGANLDGADLRGALELKASQVCSSKSRRGALLDDALAMQVTTECGGLQ